MYMNATRILVWFGGNGNGYASKAFQLRRSLHSIFDEKLRLSLFRVAGANVNWISQTSWQSLQELTQQEWSSRVWIPQEIGTPKMSFSQYFGSFL